MSEEVSIKKVVVYTRVSSSMQIDGYSLEYQKEVVENHAKLKGYEIIKYYEDAGKSGKNTNDRPQFNLMMKDIQKASSSSEPIDAILVYKLSRFSRSIADLSNSIVLLKKMSCYLVAVDDNLDTTTKMGEAVMQVIGIFASLERDNIMDNAKSGMKSGALAGHWMGGVAPFGYKTVPKTDKNTSTLAINEAEAVWIKWIFTNYAEGLGYASIIRKLNLEHKITTRKGNPWNYTLIQQILDNPVYIGKIRFGRYKEWNDLERMIDTKEKKGEKKRKLNENVILVDGKHEAIIDLDTWNNVRAIRDERGFKRVKTREGYHLLSGKILCPQCGTPMVKDIVTRTNKDGSKKDNCYYKCGKWNNTKECKPNLILKEVVEKQFKEILFKITANKKLHQLVAEKLNKEIDVSEHQEFVSRCRIENTSLFKQREKIKKMLFENDETITGVTDDEISKQILSLNQQIEANENLILKKETEITMIENEAKTSRDIAEILVNFRTVFEASPHDMQRELVKHLVKNITVTPSDSPKERSQIQSIQLQFNSEEIAKLDLQSSFEFISDNEINVGFSPDTVHPS